MTTTKKIIIWSVVAAAIAGVIWAFFAWKKKQSEKEADAEREALLSPPIAGTGIVGPVFETEGDIEGIDTV